MPHIFCQLVLLWQRSFVWERVFVCCSQVNVSWQTISCQTEKRNSAKHRQIWRGKCVEDVNSFVKYSQWCPFPTLHGPFSACLHYSRWHCCLLICHLPGVPELLCFCRAWLDHDSDLGATTPFGLFLEGFELETWLGLFISNIFRINYSFSRWDIFIWSKARLFYFMVYSFFGFILCRDSE